MNINITFWCLFFFQGFGVGNFKALFDAIELEQAERGNLWFILYRSFQGRLQDFWKGGSFELNCGGFALLILSHFS